VPTNAQFAVGELVTASDANTLFVRGYRNRIINGAFVINQRGYTSGTNLASGSYGFDRWKSGYTNTALTFTAGSQSTTVTISSSGVLQQIVERENMPAGTYVLSWSGTATGRVYNSGATPPSYAASPITVTLDGLANVVVEFTASGGTKTLGTVQLEGGTVFSPFEYRHRGEEFILCQRYYQRLGGNVAGDIYISGFQPASTSIVESFNLPVRLRANPSLAQRVGTWTVINSASQPAVNSPSLDTYAVTVVVNAGIGNTNQSGAYTASTSTYLEFSAEL
jgi:hypothetical protein